MEKHTEQFAAIMKQLHESMTTAVEQSHELLNKDLRSYHEDFREATGRSVHNSFDELTTQLEALKLHMDRVRIAAYIREVDPSLNKPDHQGRPWTAIVREGAHYKVHVESIRAAREAFSFSIAEGKIAVDLYREDLI